MKIMFGFGVVSASTLAAAYFAFGSGAEAQSQDRCPAAPVRDDAVDRPSKHAWDLFVALNHPAKDKAVARGDPDCSKPLGAPGTTAVWETWRNADSEVYLLDGKEPPPWADVSLPDEKPGAVPVVPVDAAGARLVSMHARSAANSEPRVAFSPDGIFDDKGGFGETRMNRSTYDFIRNECLFSVEGQRRYAAAVATGKKRPISFPVESIEAKAAWIDFEKYSVPKDRWGTYYTAEYKGRNYGLIALHIITKDIPNWFWASFHHKDNPTNEFESGDDSGPAPSVAGTVWENYRLGGTQIDFTGPTGVPSRLSDHYVEFGFQRSSCITCHATATISQTGSMPGAQQRAVCAMTPAAGGGVDRCKKALGDDAFTATGELRMERGTPDPKWFERTGKPYYLQTDFVYSIPFRGQPEKGPPPARCLW